MIKNTILIFAISIVGIGIAEIGYFYWVKKDETKDIIKGAARKQRDDLKYLNKI